MHSIVYKKDVQKVLTWIAILSIHGGISAVAHTDLPLGATVGRVLATLVQTRHVRLGANVRREVEVFSAGVIVRIVQRA